jgi:hypothetical protein
MVRTFDRSLWLQTLEGKNASGSLQGVLCGHDSVGRLSTVSGNGYTAAYSYGANSLLVSGLAMTNVHGVIHGVRLEYRHDIGERLPHGASKPGRIRFSHPGAKLIRHKDAPGHTIV